METLTSAPPSEKPRQRITKACDRCNASRSKCNGARPCERCQENGVDCTYHRQSRRHGRVSKNAALKKQSIDRVSSEAAIEGLSKSSGADSTTAVAFGTSTMAQLASPHGADATAGATSVSTGGLTPNLWRAPPTPRLSTGSVPEASSSHTISAGAAGLTMSSSQPLSYIPPGLPTPVGYAALPDGQEWLNDPWLAALSEPLGYWNTAPSQALASGISPGAGFPSSTPAESSIIQSPDARRSHDSKLDLSDLRYPVLKPLIPYIAKIMSVRLACELLDSYAANIEDGVSVPTSPLLLTHIFRRESLLSTARPRACSPALLASMLMISAHTTESPFFGTSPAARIRLYQQLLQLTLDLLEGGSPSSELRRQRRQALATRLYRSGPDVVLHPASTNGALPPFTPREPRSYVDDIVTYMHVALVTTTAESKPAGLRWWHTAFQLAKEFKLNRDAAITTSVAGDSRARSTSQHPSDHRDSGDMAPVGHGGGEDEDMSDDAATPMSFNDDGIVESRDARRAATNFEEKEERRRVWWALYIWVSELIYTQRVLLTLLPSGP
jgi:xylanolytic transcriptional activator XlnR